MAGYLNQAYKNMDVSLYLCWHLDNQPVSLTVVHTFFMKEVECQAKTKTFIAIALPYEIRTLIHTDLYSYVGGIYLQVLWAPIIHGSITIKT